MTYFAYNQPLALAAARVNDPCAMKPAAVLAGRIAGIKLQPSEVGIV